VFGFVVLNNKVSFSRSFLCYMMIWRCHETLSHQIY